MQTEPKVLLDDPSAESILAITIFCQCLEEWDKEQNMQILCCT